MGEKHLAVVVLAAGEGTRMRSKTPKVMHEIAGLPMLGHVLATASALDAAHIIPVVRHQKEILSDFINSFYPNANIAEQDEISGTGRAVECGLKMLPSDFEGAVIVTSGDVPLLDVATLESLLEAHLEGNYAASVLTAIVEDPAGYGRVIRSNDGKFLQIIEDADADAEQLEISEVNAGIYVFDAALLQRALGTVSSHNAQGEKYLTDVAAELIQQGQRVQALAVTDNWLVAGINDRVQLAEVSAELNYRICEAWQRSGVTILDPSSTWIDVTVALGEDVTLLPGTHLRGFTRIGSGSQIGPEAEVIDSQIAENVVVSKSKVVSSVISDGAVVGPFAYLRAGTELGSNGKIGSFVETKNAKIGSGSKIPHLSYVGDAEIGQDTNIGAGTIFANYDGVNKHSTKIGSNVRSGSHNVFVAPITIGDGAYTAAGAVIRKDVASGDLGMSVAPQRNLAGWVVANRPGTKSADVSKTKN
jgi:bifunctional UDP-N-acetylglucosamine pyrophosphorylase/glucosamine-1-phosphate N-acetyltransferase